MTTSPAAPGAAAVRPPADTRSYDAALAGFDELLPGQTVVVVAEREPRELLQRLQADRKGTFEWSLLEAGPSTFRVELTRRSAERGTPREVGEALAWDHDRLDTLERRAIGDDVPLPLRAELHRVLGQHNLKEERVLYPATDRALGPAERDALVGRIQAS